MRRTSIFLVPALVDAAICANQSQPEGVVKVGIMKLEIVWRNPQPPGTRKLLVKQIVADAYGALYAVRSAHEIKVFELLESRAA